VRLAPLLVAAACATAPGRPSDAPRDYDDTIPGTVARFRMVAVPGARIWIGRTEVTWEEFEAWYLSDEEQKDVDALARPSPFYFPHDRGWGAGRRPAVGISRHAAERYCAWLSRRTGRLYRLPTEAEWELACAGSPPGWTKETSGGRTQEVGLRPPNPLGLCDMLGNVWEYCSNDWDVDDARPVMRGGCWDDPAAEVSCRSRRPLPEEWNESDPQRPKSVWWLADGPYVGFRLARSFGERP